MKELTSQLLVWYKENSRALPWRTNYEPYHVFISELMLQQTQMERGVEYFNRWLIRFPTIFDVANASEEDILHAWEGLGYYRRARYLHETTKKICAEHNGTIPNDKDILKTFKGLGDYTIAAICGIAYNQDIVTIDANVDRVFSRLFCIEGDTKKNPTKERIKSLAYEYLPIGKARFYNQSLMELGALICKKNPLCELCPLHNFCKAYATNTQNLYPSPKEKQKLVYEDWIQLIFTLKNENTKVELYAVKQREKNLHWGGLFEFYSFEAHSRNHAQIIKSEMEKLEINDFSMEEFTNIPYSYTNHRNNASFYKISINSKYKNYLEKELFFSWLTHADLQKIAFPSPYRKAIKKI